ncbi:SIK1 [Symbiodinium sp. CCMP2456]|nr:SIK1 [Symbiodinium sp. CCMP2456]
MPNPWRFRMLFQCWVCLQCAAQVLLGAVRDQATLDSRIVPSSLIQNASILPRGASKQRKGVSRGPCKEKENLRAALTKIGCPTEYFTSEDHCRWKGVFCHKDFCAIRKLVLPRRSLAGDMSGLSALARLQALVLTNTKVVGSLSILAKLTELQRLQLSGTRVTGDVRALENLTKLVRLDLSKTAIAGNLQSLEKFLKMKVLHMAGTEVGGKLHALRNLTRIQDLDLSGTKLTGGLHPLRRLRRLQRLLLSGSQVTGDFRSLENLTDLSLVNLAESAVSGKLHSLAKLSSLSELVLSRTHTSGSLQDLANLTQLKDLRMSETRVVGGLASLEVMSGLTVLDLAGTVGVNGAIAALIRLESLEIANLASTQVSGRLTSDWRGHLRNLRTLNLAGSQVQFLPSGKDVEDLRYLFTAGIKVNALLPALKELDVSRCLVHGPVEDLLWPLAASPCLVKLAAAGNNLTGPLPDFENMHLVSVNGDIRKHYKSFLSSVLQSLDLSGNQLDRIEGLVAGTLLALRDNTLPVTFAAGVLQQALDRSVHLDLTGVTLSNSDEAMLLFAKQRIKTTRLVATTDIVNGFACFDLQDSVLQVTPDRFLPQLLCGCSPGHSGLGTYCLKCSAGRYNPKFNQSMCLPCPQGSTSSPGASSAESCQCNAGRIAADSDDPRCACEAHTAYYQKSCIECSELNLDCPDEGSLAESARPKSGYARLSSAIPNASRCLDLAEERCKTSANSSELGCAQGYEGPLCTACANGYRSSGHRCRRCAQGHTLGRWPAVMVAVAVAAAVGAIFAWRRRSAPREATASTASTPEARAVLSQLLLAQGPVLLQLCQLWGVLVALSQTTQSSGPAAEGQWEQEYVQWLQLTAGGLRDALSIECAYGRTSRTVSALAAPCMPLLLLGLSGAVEAVARGCGVSMALKALSLFFIGGASSCAKLLHCQRLDGGGEPLQDRAFRALLPHKLCAESDGEAAWADRVGFACAVAYGILIPGFLLSLILKQHLVLAPSRRFVFFSEPEGEKTLVGVRVLKPPDGAETAEEEELRARHLLASAVAYSAVFFHGRVRLQLQADTMTVQRIEDKLEDADGAELDVNSLLWTALKNKADEDLERCRAIARMLTEQYILDKAKASDRILAGSTELFFKYVACKDVWLEMAMKLVAVALVASVASQDNNSLMLVLGITTGTAILLGTLKPYRQRQVNDLQSCCFYCLAASALGFALGSVWLPRCTLAAPFALAAAQTLRPDGPEALALRISEAANARWSALQQGDPVDCGMETLSGI